MKPTAFLFSALTAAAASFAFLTPSFADAPELPILIIDNHQKLVTVKDGDGAWVFAQVISTPNLKISTTLLGKRLSRISLQDGTGKVLWSETVGDAVLRVHPYGEWSDKFASTAWPMISGLGWKTTGTDDKLECKREEVVVGSEDQLVKLRISTSKHSVEITPIKNGFVAKMDNNKTVIILQPPIPVSAPAVASNP